MSGLRAHDSDYADQTIRTMVGMNVVQELFRCLWFMLVTLNIIAHALEGGSQ